MIRDGWISFTGNEAAILLAKQVFADLETTQRTGLHISDRDFRHAIDVANPLFSLLDRLTSVLSSVGEKTNS